MPAPVDRHRALAAAIPPGTIDDPAEFVLDGLRYEYRDVAVNSEGFLVLSARAFAGSIVLPPSWDIYWFWNPPDTDRLGRLHVVNQRAGLYRSVSDAVLANARARGWEG